MVDWYKRAAFAVGTVCLVAGSAIPTLAQNESGIGKGVLGRDGVAAEVNTVGAGISTVGEPVILRPSGPVPGQYIVVFDDDISNPRGLANALARQNGFALRGVFGTAIKGFAARMPQAVAERLALDPNVAYVEQDLYAQADLLVTGVDRIDAELNAAAAIDGFHNEVDVDVAVIDTGIHPHSDLNVHAFYDCIGGCSGNGNPGTAFDDNGHGTHVAGSIGALDDGTDATIDGVDYEVVGVAPGARIWGFKVLDSGGSGSFADIIDAIDEVTAHAAEIEVVNMSLSGVGVLESLRTAIQNSVGAGVVYVVAAGNASQDIYGGDGKLDHCRGPICLGGNDTIPAAYPEVMTVSALADFDGDNGALVSDADSTIAFQSCTHTGDDVFACFTNFSQSVDSTNPVSSPGAAIDVAGPGMRILSTYNNGGYAWGSGTSMASPHVAGAVALEIVANGRATNASGVYAIRQALINGAQPQSEWQTGNTEDPDNNPEGLVYVGGDALGDPPAVSWVNPNGSTPVSGLVPIEITATDTEDDPNGNTGLLTVEWSDDGGATWDPTTFNSTSDRYEATWDSTSVLDGNRTLTARVRDSESNESTSNVIVTVDNVDDPPAVSWVNPDGSISVNGLVPIEIAATDTEDDPNGSAGLLTVEWSDDGGATWKPTTFDGASDRYEATWDTTILSDGDHTLRARAEDSQANETIQDIVVTVSNTAPAFGVTISYFGDGGRSGTKHLNSRIVVEDNGSPISGASVNATVDRIDTISGGVVESRTETATTDSNGEVDFSWKNADSDCYETHVNSIDTQDMSGQTAANSIIWPDLISEMAAWCDGGTELSEAK